MVRGPVSLSMHKRTLLLLGSLWITGCGNGSNPLVPHVRPVEGGTVSSGYGPRENHPVKGLMVGGHHTGYDFAVGSGSPIRASMAGTVSFVGLKGGYGKAVVLEHPDGYSTLYGHASELLVRQGQSVAQGQTIALVGSTGISTGPHLHYELRKGGLPVNPGPFLNEEDPVAMAAAHVEPPAVKKLTVKQVRLVDHFRMDDMVPVASPGRALDRG